MSSERRRDAGLTLPELLITVTVLGMVAAVLCGTIVMTLRSTDSSSGRLDIARSEQVIGFHLPNDLASAGPLADTDPDVADATEPDLTPCLPTCPSYVPLPGSNALLLTWKARTGPNATDTAQTRVSYRYVETDVDGHFQIVRVACTQLTIAGAWNCTSLIVLSDLVGPSEFTAGDPVPSDVFAVSAPAAPDSVSAEPASGDVAAELSKNANRVDVTLDGGGPAPGAGGGVDQVDLTGGGTNRTTIAADSTLHAPTLAASCAAGMYCFGVHP